MWPSVCSTVILGMFRGSSVAALLYCLLSQPWSSVDGVLQFGCEGAGVLLCQQQGPSAPCFRGASSLCRLSSSPKVTSTHFFVQLGALQRLNRMLASPMLHMKQHAALSLSFLCSTNSTAQLAAVDAGALSVVQDLIASKRSHAVVTGLRFIFNLACVASFHPALHQLLHIMSKTSFSP
jgi:hypothetical protein